MKCQICENECPERTNTATYFYNGKNHRYEYRQFCCYRHYPFRWQTDEQMKAALNEIEKIKKQHHDASKH
jgi:hypothetical protein